MTESSTRTTQIDEAMTDRLAAFHATHGRDVELDVVAIDPLNPTDQRIVSVASTNFSGGVQATIYLLDLGHRHIAFAGGPPESYASMERFHGYRSALESRGLTADPAIVIHGAFTYESGVEMGTALLNRDDRGRRSSRALTPVRLGSTGPLGARSQPKPGTPILGVLRRPQNRVDVEHVDIDRWRASERTIEQLIPRRRPRGHQRASRPSRRRRRIVAGRRGAVRSKKGTSSATPVSAGLLLTVLVLLILRYLSA